MAYTGVYMICLGGGVELAQRRQDGALFMRDATGYGKYGRNAGKWFPVKEAVRDEIGDLRCNGVNFGRFIRVIDSCAFRIAVDLPGYVFDVPDFEIVKNSPAIIRVDDLFNDNDGSYQLIYWRDAEGIIHCKNNKFENSDFHRWTISDLMPEMKPETMEQAKPKAIIFSDTMLRLSLGEAVVTPRGTGTVLEVRDTCLFPIFVKLADGTVDAFKSREIKLPAGV